MSSGGEGGASFERYLSDKKALIAKGVRIVYIPPHANCSKRCQPYQGKLYSLDGTSGSIEGKGFVPIENAADKVTATSKSSGNTYNAGLFSFNCRHKMQEYESGMVLEEIPDEVIEQYRAAESKQKNIEKQIRTLKSERDYYTAVHKKSPNMSVYRHAYELNQKAVTLTKEYAKISETFDIPTAGDIVKPAQTRTKQPTENKSVLTKYVQENFNLKMINDVIETNPKSDNNTIEADLTNTNENDIMVSRVISGALNPYGKRADNHAQ